MAVKAEHQDDTHRGVTVADEAKTVDRVGKRVVLAADDWVRFASGNQGGAGRKAAPLPQDTMQRVRLVDTGEIDIQHAERNFA
jgi:hypothetical protein